MHRNNGESPIEGHRTVTARCTPALESRFKAEAAHRKSVSLDGPPLNGAWDCDSKLYDSFELQELAQRLARGLTCSETSHMSKPDQLNSDLCTGPVQSRSSCSGKAGTSAPDEQGRSTAMDVARDWAKMRGWKASMGRLWKGMKRWREGRKQWREEGGKHEYYYHHHHHYYHHHVHELSIAEERWVVGEDEEKEIEGGYGGRSYGGRGGGYTNGAQRRKKTKK